MIERPDCSGALLRMNQHNARSHPAVRTAMIERLIVQSGDWRRIIMTTSILRPRIMMIAEPDGNGRTKHLPLASVSSWAESIQPIAKELKNCMEANHRFTTHSISIELMMTVSDSKMIFSRHALKD